MKLWRAKLEDNVFDYDIVDIPENEWITEKPYATMQDVFIQDFDGNVSFSWVNTEIEKGSDGRYQISGLCGGDGAKPIKCWMVIPPFYEDPTGWHSDYTDDADLQPARKKYHEYLVCVEYHRYGRVEYKLKVARYSPTKKSDWAGYEGNDVDVVAWREFPRPASKR